MNARKMILILGPPGSGKGTQGKMLAPLLGYSYVSMGQVLRQVADSGTELGQKIKATIDKGVIIPDEWIRVIFDEMMMNLPEGQSLVLDGFPRDLDQAPILETAIQTFNITDLKVLFILVPEQRLIERLNERGVSSGRADDAAEVLHTRFEQYRQRTLPIKDYFKDKGTLIEINGDQPIQAVHEEIKQKLGL